MSRHERTGVRSVIQQTASTASTPGTGSSLIRKRCIYSGCSHVSSGADEKLVAHAMGSHVSNCHGALTHIYYGDKKITIGRDVETQEMRCPCGFAHVNSAIVRKHATKEHKTGGTKTVVLSNRQPSRPAPSTSRTPSRLESASEIEFSDTPLPSRTSISLSSLSKGNKVSSSATPQRNPLDMIEKKLFKSPAARTTAARPLSIFPVGKLGEKARADAPRRKSAQTALLIQRQPGIPPIASGSSRAAVPTKPVKKPSGASSAVVVIGDLSTERPPSIAKPSFGRSAPPDTVSAGNKRAGSPSLATILKAPKARKVSQVSDAPPSAASSARATVRTTCATCRGPLNPLHYRWKNCDECRRKSREKQRMYARMRRERAANGAGGGAMDVDEDEDEEDEAAAVAAEVRRKKGVRCVWDDVPEFQTEDELLAAAATRAWAGAVPFEFCGGYAVVAGTAAVDEGVTRKLCDKLVARGVPMMKLLPSPRVVRGGPAPVDGAYHVFESLEMAHFCTCRDGLDARAARAANVCGGKVTITLQTTNEKSELGVYGLNVVVQTSHTR